MVFSTDCSFFQDWQSLLVFHSARAVGQPGVITRIASGCSEDKQQTLVSLYNKLFPQYHVHFTPDFKKDKKSGKEYDFYNKPYGVEHWLDHAVPAVDDTVVVAIIDPDMIFIRPLTAKVAGEQNLILLTECKGRGKNCHDKLSRLSPEEGRWDTPPAFIERGHPAAQLYGLGAPWAGSPTKEFNRMDVCGLTSPCMNTTNAFGERHYSVGPPYLVEKHDLIRLTKTWAKFVPTVYERNPDLLSEMYAYSMAAAHEYLPHFTMMHYMVSNTNVEEEGWKWVDGLGDDVCRPPRVVGTGGGRGVRGAGAGAGAGTGAGTGADTGTGAHTAAEGAPAGAIDRTQYYPDLPMPALVHYCQFFRIGELGFQKRRIQGSFLDCDFPLMVEPPVDVGKLRYKNRDGEVQPVWTRVPPTLSRPFLYPSFRPFSAHPRSSLTPHSALTHL